VIARSTPTSDGRWPIALRAAISTAIPVAVGWAAGNVGSGLIATLGAFTSRFGSGRPYLNRGVQLAVVAVALAAAVAVGSWAAQVLEQARAVMAARGLEHATVQVEPPEGAGDCEKHAHK
jgi:uncharacterized membrane protein YccC